jgi:predicted RNase H-like HicB family nuclease
MLAEYIDKAMEQAVYEIIEAEGTYWGEIPGLQGVWARHTTLKGCRRELREALSDWIALRLRLGLSIPVLAGIDLNQLTQLRDVRFTLYDSGLAYRQSAQ